MRQPEPEAEKYPEIELKLDKPTDSNTILLQLGDICCALKCRDTEVYTRLQQLYREFETERPPDITIDLELTDRLSPEKLETSVFKSQFLQWGGTNFRTTHGIMSGKYDPARRFIKIKGERNLCNPDLKINHLNRLISLAYYSACKLKHNNIPPAMLVHTCGVVRNGRALLFTGPSGAGKTTVARLCGEQDGEVINDEMLLVSRPGKNDNVISVQSAPILGKFPPQRNVTAPLRCIILLKQGSSTQARRLDNTEAYIRFMRQIIAPACIGQKDKRTIYSMMADFSAQVTGVVPVYELEFTLNGESLWQTIGDIERTLDNKERQ